MTSANLTFSDAHTGALVRLIEDNCEEEHLTGALDDPSLNGNYILTIAPLLNWGEEQAFFERSGLTHRQFLGMLEACITEEEIGNFQCMWLRPTEHPQPLFSVNYVSPYKRKSTVGLSSAIDEAFRRFCKQIKKRHSLQLGVDFDLSYNIVVVKEHGRLSREWWAKP